MGSRLTLRIYKGCDENRFRSLAEDAVLAVGGKGIVWGRPPANREEDFRVAHSGAVHTLFVEYQGTDYLFAKKLGELGGLPWIEARIQEGSHWDYTLYAGAQVADNFSTDPDYFHEKDDQAHLKGDPAKLASLWGIPVERIERYIRHWGRRDNDDGTYDHTLTGKAYPDDEAPYGNHAQLIDFVRALGGSYPQDEHTIRLPKPKKKNAGPLRLWWKLWR